MNTKDVIYNLRTKSGLSQDELAGKVFVTRQAVSRWENGETVPGTETLKLLSDLFGVSINTLLGSPQALFCQCCGMPMEDEIIGRNKDGSLNESYCKWCYADGSFTYSDMDELINICIPHMVSQGFTEDQAREYMKERLPQLDYWKNFDKLNDNGRFDALKATLIDEINALSIPGMPKVERLNALVGNFVNLEYPLPGGQKAKFLNDDVTYLGTQLETGGDEEYCFGVVANEEFILICTYECEGTNPKLVMFKKR